MATFILLNSLVTLMGLIVIEFLNMKKYEL
jgi:hypothetical protein